MRCYATTAVGVARCTPKFALGCPQLETVYEMNLPPSASVQTFPLMINPLQVL
jgi:hypothetical protein